MKAMDVSAGSKSILAKPVQELVKMIFDVESMKKVMLEFEVRPVKINILFLTCAQVYH